MDPASRVEQGDQQYSVTPDMRDTTDMVLIEAGFGSDAYHRTLELRKRILRDPLDLEWTDEEMSWEAKERHFGAIVKETIVACLVIRSLGRGVVKLRQMAVDTEYQGVGWGCRLIRGVEHVLAGEDVSRVELHARETAVGFYERIGFTTVGEQFLEVNIPHWKMWKSIS